MTFSIDNPEGGCNNPPLRKTCLGKTVRRTRVKRYIYLERKRESERERERDRQTDRQRQRQRET